MTLELNNGDYGGDPADPRTRRARQRIHWICRQAVGKDVLDLACGSGIVCLMLGREGFRCTGVDMDSDSVRQSEAALSKQPGMVRERVKFRLAEPTELPFADASFDTVVIREELQRRTHPQRLLSEAGRVLRNQGRVIITVPCGLMASSDHENTYYPLALLQELQPFFSTCDIRVVGDYITYTGVKQMLQTPREYPKQSPLEEYLPLVGNLEARCLEKETALLDLRWEKQAQSGAIIEELSVSGQNTFRIGDGPPDKSKQSRQAGKSSAEPHTRGDAEPAAWESKLAVAQLECRHAQQRVLAQDAELKRVQAELSDAKAALQQNEEKCVVLQAEIDRCRQDLNRERAEGRKRLTEADSRHACQLHDCENRWKELLAHQEEELKYMLLAHRIRELAHCVLPSGARVLVISKGDGELVRLNGCVASHFPQTGEGIYAGHHPSDSSEAISHLERLRAEGAQYLLVPASSFWWLDYYQAFHEHLQKHCRLVTYRDTTCMIFALAGTPSREPGFQLAARSRYALTTMVDGATGSQASAKGVVPAPKPTAASGVAGPTQVSSTNGARGHPPGGGKDGGPRPSVACIVDEFTQACLAPESSLVTFRPDNWKNMLDQTSIDLLLVESAWHGNDNSWENRIALPHGTTGRELSNLIQYCRRRDVPTVFWNKEDPVHFAQFIGQASLFDFIFTTDADCISRYRERVGHDRVFALPFAAQPAIHNPIQENPRGNGVCFAGSYYADRHRERQCDLDYLLPPAIRFGLEIYDRQHGMSGEDSEAYRFPDAYQPFIKGRLAYDQMVKAYKKYRVFLNVNSVKRSPTMFSRRVFELLACGTPVVSTYSDGIANLLGKDTVFFTESESETGRHLESLLGNEDAWTRASLRGLRRVMQAHTYRDRLREVFERVGIGSPECGPPRVGVLIKLGQGVDLQRVVSLVSAQIFSHIDLLIISPDAVSASALTTLRNALPQGSVTSIHGQASTLLAGRLAASSADYLALFDGRDCYGPNYLEDLRLAAMYSGSDFLGKHSFYEVAPRGTRTLRRPGYEYRWVDCVESATLLIRKSALSQELLSQVLQSRTFRIPEARVLSLDRFNYLQNGSALGDEHPAEVFV